MRISFVGDIMCELPTLYRAKKRDYEFDDLFGQAKSVFSKSDIIIANLETVFGGERAGYSKDIYNYNSPDTFCNTLSQLGISLVSTANNHCLDRGINGLISTLDVLDQNNIRHVGTYRSKKEREQTVIFNMDGLRIAFLSYTAQTNYAINSISLNEDQEFMVGLLETPEWKKETKAYQGIIDTIKEKLLKRSTRIKIMKIFGKKYNRPRVDNACFLGFREEVIEEIKKANREADIVIVLLHSGGQFNDKPGRYTRKVVEGFAELGVDYVIANHPHVVQEVKEVNKSKVAFSLGNFFVSPDTVYLLNEFLPLYSIALHIDFQKNTSLASFSILKTIKDQDQERVVDVYSYYNGMHSEEEKMMLKRDCELIFERVGGNKMSPFEIMPEYEIHWEV